MHFIIVLPPWFLWVFLVSQLNDIPITEALLFHFPILDTCDLGYIDNDTQEEFISKAKNLSIKLSNFKSVIEKTDK